MNRYVLVAYNPTSGHGVIKAPSGFFLLAPPFGTMPLRELGQDLSPYDFSEENGYVQCNEVYFSIDVIHFRLEEIAWQARESAGDKRSPSITLEERAEFFKTMPRVFIENAIERACMYIESGQTERAAFVLESLLENPNLNQVEKVVLELMVKVSYLK